VHARRDKCKLSGSVCLYHFLPYNMADVLESTAQAVPPAAAASSAGGTLGDAKIPAAVHQLAQVAVNLAGTSGFLMKNSELNGFIHAPFSLLPRKVRKAFLRNSASIAYHAFSLRSSLLTPCPRWWRSCHCIIS